MTLFYILLFYDRPFLHVCNLVENLLFSTLIVVSVFNDYVDFYRDTTQPFCGVLGLRTCPRASVQLDSHADGSRMTRVRHEADSSGDDDRAKVTQLGEIRVAVAGQQLQQRPHSLHLDLVQFIFDCQGHNLKFKLTGLTVQNHFSSPPPTFQSYFSHTGL